MSQAPPLLQVHNLTTVFPTRRGTVEAVSLVLALRPRRISAISAIFLIGSLGFAVAALIQGRGYLNHALPGMALGFAGLILVAAESTVAWARRRFVLTAAAVLSPPAR